MCIIYRTIPDFTGIYVPVYRNDRNTFGALSIAAGLFGMPMAVALRVGMNVFGALYTVICNKVIDRLAAVSEERRSSEA